MSNRIRIRATLSRAWLWELLTPDGHVAASSAQFCQRNECETDALKQGLPVQGLTRTARRKMQAPSATPVGLRVYSDRSGLWRWTVADDVGQVVARSDKAFLTQAEALGDADLRAPRRTDTGQR
jgi:hypothetical protein